MPSGITTLVSAVFCLNTLLWITETLVYASPWSGMLTSVPLPAQAIRCSVS